VDVVALQIVTVGDAASELFQKLQSANEYTEAFYVHGLGVETAEACAEWMHRKLRHDLGIPSGQGKRYSWGYGACPDLEDHAQVFKLLPAERELGMQMTSSFQLMPEQSTAAIIVHHPQAKYYAVSGEAKRPRSWSVCSTRTPSSYSTVRWARCCTAKACSSTSATTS
jgi:5-methyltetrahydrofolate--homocysteine methyltransferase